MIKRKKTQLFSNKLSISIKNITSNTIIRAHLRYYYCTYVHDTTESQYRMRKFLFIAAMFFCTTFMSAQTPNRQFTIATMNIDGLPPSLSAIGINIPINPDGPQEKYTAAIAEKFMEKNWDIIGLNEDFNFHNTLTENISGYQVMTHGGKLEANAWIALAVIARTYRYSSDGLGLLVKEPMKARNEVRKAWEDCYGYFDHDNDSLTKKGFRHYEVDLDEKATLDVIVLHADAYEADPDRIAREKQMTQLMNYIEANKHCNHPLVIMGDYNQRFGEERLTELVLSRINNNKSLNACDAWTEYSKTHSGIPEEIDKIIFVNNSKCDYKIVLKDFANGYDFLREDGTALSDHWPVYATFEIDYHTPTGITETTTTLPAVRKHITNGRIIIERNGKKYSITGEEL